MQTANKNKKQKTKDKNQTKTKNQKPKMGLSSGLYVESLRDEFRDLFVSLRFGICLDFVF